MSQAYDAPPLPPILQTAVDWMLKLQNYFTELRQFHDDEEDRLIVAAEIVRIDDLTGGGGVPLSYWISMFRSMEDQKRRLTQ